MSEIPTNWVLTPIGSLCSLKNGRAFKPTEWVKDGLPIVRIQNLNNTRSKFNYFDGEYNDNYYLRGGELLFAWSGTPGTSFGAHVWKGGEAVLNQHIFRVDFEEDTLDKRFFKHAINQKLNDLIGVAQGGVGLRHITKGKFESTEISLPPLNEQKRIADKLDTLLAAVDACRARLDKIHMLIKRFRRTVLAAATSGALTEDWRLQRNTEDNSFPLVPFGSLIKSIRGGSNEVPSYDVSDFPVLRSSSVRQKEINFLDVKYLDGSQSSDDKNFIENGDILFTRLNGTAEYVGNCVVVTGVTPKKYQYPDRLFCAKIKDGTSPTYCMYAFSSPDVRNEIEARAKSTAGHKRISIQDVKEIEIRLPEIEEQIEIVGRVEVLFAIADKLEASLVTARKRVDQLTPAILAQAFRGELVEQHPTDESANALLARIAAESTPVAPRRTTKKAA
jgi:type I restriction enzyme S subunit